MGGNLKDDTDDVDETAQDDGSATTDDVGTVTRDERTEESTSRQDGDDERLVGTLKRSGTGTLDESDEDLRANDTVDVSRVITIQPSVSVLACMQILAPFSIPEEDTTEGGESAEQVGLPSYGCLDAVDIGGGSQRRGTSRHDGRGLV